MTSPLVDYSDELNLGGQAITNVMTTGQLELIARCILHAVNDQQFRVGLTGEQLEEALSLATMFVDPDLKTSPRELLHGFCL